LSTRFPPGRLDDMRPRCGLRDARTGERLALIAYRPDGTTGAYRETGPVFVHADRCDGYREPSTYPEAFRPRDQVFRAYDRDGRIHDAVLVRGPDAESAIEKIFVDPDIATAHSRNVLHGLRAGGPSTRDRVSARRPRPWLATPS
jgi:hypothetical protein